jgi:hypothetical protein
VSDPAKTDVVLRIALGLFAGLFVFAGAVQLNDVDPWLWVAVYGAAALLCAASAAGVDMHPAAPLAGLALASIGAVYLAWVVFVSQETQAMFPDETTNPGLLDLEEAREMFGLVLVAAAAALAALRERRS